MKVVVLICDVIVLKTPPQAPPSTPTRQLRVMDATHHCALWRDDHWVQRYNNGIADRESRSHGLPWLHHLSCTCGRGPRYIADARNRGSGSAGIRAGVHLPSAGLLLCSVERIALQCINAAASMKAAHTFGQLAPFFLPVTLMGNSILRRENACDEGIIGTSEHVSGHYRNTVWWHS